MLHVTRSIYSLLVFILLIGCTTTPSERRVVGPATKVFFASYDETWRAAQKAMINYPLRVNNIDSGVLETEIIKGVELWPSPHLPKRKQPGLRYSIKLIAVKGDAPEDHPETSISIHKSLKLERDFFSGEDGVYSNGLEEEMLMYRIDREITLERAIERAYKKSK